MLLFVLNISFAGWNRRHSRPPFLQGSFKSVTGTFIVPTPQAASGETEGSASAWVGIDGNACETAILQTGVDFTIVDGQVSYDGPSTPTSSSFTHFAYGADPLLRTAWYEWYPDYAYDYAGITISAGDNITTTVSTTSTTDGTAEIINNTTGETVSMPLTSTYALCRQNAEWIVEDYEEGNSLVPLANFGTVTFADASAGLVAGRSVAPGTADVISLEQRTARTNVSVMSTSVMITYIGA